MPLGDLHFIRPYWLLGLLPAILVLTLLWRNRRSETGWNGLIAPRLLQHLMVGRSGRSGHLPLILLGCGWFLAIVSLAGPTWERQSQPVYRANLDQVMVLDLSPSMANTDIPPDRVTRARFVINDLMAQSAEGRTALVVFGAEHHVVTPLTDDAATVAQLLRALTVDVLPTPGDRAAAALRESVQLLAAAKSRAAHVILLSDGISDPADSISAAVELHRAGARLSVIGIGTGHEAQLRELARSGGGVYRAFGSTDLHPALEVQAIADFSPSSQRDVNVDLWVEKGVWLLLPLLLVVALGYRRGWLAVVVVGFCQQPLDAMAWGWDDLWFTPDQQAKRLLDEGQAQQAAELFEDPNWRATAHYRSGEFDKAAAQFSAPGGAYNRANALARAGKLQEALKSYDEALRRFPADDDARFNRTLVKQLLDQQQQQGSSAQSPQEEASEQQRGESSDQAQQQSEQQQSTGSESETQQAQANDGEDRQTESGTADNSPTAGKDDADRQGLEQQQVKDDVAPQSALESGARRRRPADESMAADEAGPPTEKELALQQWLRQVPDDPGGLLRRKFMLEHLQRKKERDDR